ncbi:MAG: arginase family protein [Cytophagales bacterium]|nr:arginase family protein [Cytophagales bacterium]MDW8383877.1 arginase family protein [Flammeovirgaceae bacterium]
MIEDSFGLFFQPIEDKNFFQNISHALGSTVVFYDQKTKLSLSETEIAIIGIGKSADLVRQKLYQFSALNRTLRIVDWGNLRLGSTYEDTCARLREVCEMCLTNDVLTVILAEDQSLDYGQFWSYETTGKIITVVSVDKTIDLQENTSDSTHSHRILSHRPNYLLEYTHLAYQRHLTSPTILEIMQQLNFELMSVGQMRDRQHDIEPIIRATDMLSFDVAALRADTFASPNASPFGLTGDEACQICWYAGMSEMLTSIGIYGYSAEHDNALRRGAHVVASMIWYFLEGFTYRREIHPFKSNFYIRYIVPIPNTSLEITFYKSKITHKWWIETSIPSVVPYNRKKVIPCSYQDYEEACRGNIPERWLRALDKL